MSTLAVWWIPVGAGGWLVSHASGLWERMTAAREGRAARPLLHAAIEITDRRGRSVIEMAPAWSGPRTAHGVVGTGPVGLRVLGLSVCFRYEIRCWRDGTVPDLAFAPRPPRIHETSEVVTDAIIMDATNAPRHVWGRDVFGIGDMWNSNSLIAWLLTRAGIAEHPPSDCSAPGWKCGVEAARRG
ncbi:hypothetical protein [Microbacterium binotii]|uniref:hypothetical protein n=1 Tax=Microbacterium binotii TaxID=462710 RepID=UPI001F391F22|nr:hypothetical protein [Microbacterium binotii]UIN29528.1 hypothetical protein LXM64_10200 [Microbacterium binotii]